MDKYVSNEIKTAMVNSWAYNGVGMGSPLTPTPTNIKNELRSCLEIYKLRIQAMEWFIVHLGLDEPPAGSLVNDIIYAGIQALEQRKII